MKVLLTNGDSWTQGDSPAQTINWHANKTLDWYDIVPNFGNPYINCNKSILFKFYDSNVWPKVLGRHLNIKTFNAGRLGSDNYSITTRTINSVEYLIKKGYTDIFVVVGWTSMTREPFYTYQKDKEKWVIDQARPYIPGFEHLYEEDYLFEDRFALNIILLQHYLEKKGINFLFFNAFDKYSNFTKGTYSHLIDTTKWIDQTLKISHFHDYILRTNNLVDWSDSEFFSISHPTDISHTQWGDYLSRYLKENYNFN